VNPPALFLKPRSPAERLAAQQRDYGKLQRERQLRSWQRKQEAKARGKAVMKRPVGAPMHARSKRNCSSSSHSPFRPSSEASTQS